MTFNFLQKSILQSVYYRETRVFLKQKNIYVCKYRVFIKYCVFFPSNFVIFLNSACSAAALVFSLRPRKNRVQNILNNSEKTQYLM